jgi:ribosome-associated protein
MIHITPDISIAMSEIQWEFIRSSGPGGQNVNKVATAVQLRFDVNNSPSLPDAVRARLIRLAGRRMTAEGFLILDARRFRTQDRNRQDAINRLVQIVRRLETKRHRGNIKRIRRSVPSSEDSFRKDAKPARNIRLNQA